MIVWGSVAYGASKAALIQLTRGLAIELAPHGVRVNCVCPGMIATRFGEGIERAAASARHVDIPLGRVADATEIADAIVYLASDRSSYATGAALVLDGGYSIA
jgi:NAD(P)-dependent dehydrogenase (short-subunit alcohol dehydrogenase family)